MADLIYGESIRDTVQDTVGAVKPGDVIVKRGADEIRKGSSVKVQVERSA